MVLPVRKTGVYPPLQAAVKEPGTLFEHNASKREDGYQWVAFFSGRIVGHITYTADDRWLVYVLVGGRARYKQHHQIYVTALTALQEELKKVGVKPEPVRLLQ
jgi:hypothetical protein